MLSGAGVERQPCPAAPPAFFPHLKSHCACRDLDPTASRSPAFPAAAVRASAIA